MEKTCYNVFITYLSSAEKRKKFNYNNEMKHNMENVKIFKKKKVITNFITKVFSQILSQKCLHYHIGAFYSSLCGMGFSHCLRPYGDL